MNEFEKLLNKLKDNYVNKIAYPDVKKVLGNQWNGVKNKAHDKISEMKKTSHTISKESIKMVFSTTAKIGYGVGKFGISSFLFCINKTKPGLYIKVLGATYFLARVTYVYGTLKESNIVIGSKWTPNSKKDIDEFKIEDKNGEVFTMKNSVWYWQFEADKYWGGMEKGKEYKIKTYGIRVDLLGIHPVIISAKGIH